MDCIRDRGERTHSGTKTGVRDWGEKHGVNTLKHKDRTTTVPQSNTSTSVPPSVLLLSELNETMNGMPRTRTRTRTHTHTPRLYQCITDYIDNKHTHTSPN